MKLTFSCSHCSVEKGKNMASVPQITTKRPKREYITVDVVDDNIYKFVCGLGHISIVYVQNLKFEMLFESGINAYFEGFYAESILTMTASLERFHEFFIELICLKNGIKLDAYKKTFQLVSKQSERQLGAFYILYLNTFNKEPIMFPQKKVEFRNEVIHKGKIPISKDVEDYAESVFYYIKDRFNEVRNFVGKDTFSKYLNLRYEQAVPKLKNLHKEHPTYQAWANPSTMLQHSLIGEDFEQRTFADSLSNAQYWFEKRKNDERNFE